MIPSSWWLLYLLQWCCCNGKLCTTFCKCQWQMVLHSYFVSVLIFVFLELKSGGKITSMSMSYSWHYKLILLRWTPDAIVFNSAQLYGTPSYWVQQFFRESSGATLLNATLLTNSSSSIVASAISWEDSENAKSFLRIKVFPIGNLCSINQSSVLRFFVSFWHTFLFKPYFMHILLEIAYEAWYIWMCILSSNVFFFYSVFLFVYKKIIKMCYQPDDMLMFVQLHKHPNFFSHLLLLPFSTKSEHIVVFDSWASIMLRLIWFCRLWTSGAVQLISKFLWMGWGQIP